MTAVVSVLLAVCAAIIVVARTMLAPGTVERRPPMVNRVLISTSTTAMKHLRGNKPTVYLQAINELQSPGRPSAQPHRRLETLVTVHDRAWALPPRLLPQHHRTDLTSPNYIKGTLGATNAPPLALDSLHADPLLPLMDSISAH